MHVVVFSSQENHSVKKLITILFEVIYHVRKVKSILLKAENHSNLCVLNI
jgi:hypothetical protein